MMLATESYGSSTMLVTGSCGGSMMLATGLGSCGFGISSQARKKGKNSELDML